MRSIIVAAAFGIAGCVDITDSPEENPHQGAALGVVQIGYRAASDADIVTETRGPGVIAAGLRIADGAAFELVPLDLRKLPHSVTLSPVDPGMLTVANDGTASAHGAGNAGVLVIDADGRTIDFAELDIRAVASIAIQADGLEPRVGEDVVIAARASDADHVALAGTILVDWQSSDERIVKLVPTTKLPGSRMRATALVPGRAKITAVVRNATASVDIVVQP
jgi:hypothetical protein